MKLKKKNDRYYPIWFESDNREFAIGILNYLFGMKCLQVLHKHGNDFWVIKEYKDYDDNEISKLLKKLNDIFDTIPNELQGNDWRVLDDRLPGVTRKYLGDNKAIF